MSFSLMIYFINISIMLEYDFLMHWDHLEVLFAFGLHISRHIYSR